MHLSSMERADKEEEITEVAVRRAPRVEKLSLVDCFGIRLGY